MGNCNGLGGQNDTPARTNQKYSSSGTTTSDSKTSETPSSGSRSDSVDSIHEKSSPRSHVCQHLYKSADAVAFWHHKAHRRSGEIRVKAGDELVRLEANTNWGSTSGTWIFVMRISGKNTSIGYIPRSCLINPDEVDGFKWNFGTIGRARAESMLLKQAEGTFLIRTHKTPADASTILTPVPARNYVLSVRFGDDCRHYKVDRTIDHGVPHFTISGDYVQYRSLGEMVGELKSGQANAILCCTLLEPARKPRPEIPEPLTVMAQKSWPEMSRRQIKIRDPFCDSKNGLYAGFLKMDMKSKKVVIRVLQEEKGSMERWLSEAVALKALSMKSRRFVRILGVRTARLPYLLVMKRYKDGSLRNYLRDEENKKIPESVLVNVSLQIADAMRIVEGMGIVHRALTADCIFVIQREEAFASLGRRPSCWANRKKEKLDDNSLTIRVGGFGYSTALQSNLDPIRASGGVGVLPLRWTAPEVMEGHEATVASDVWSFGIVLHEIFSRGEEPYPGSTDESVQCKFLEQGWQYKMSRSPSVPEKIYDLLLRCCRYNRELRLSFYQIYMFLDRYYDDK